MRLTLYYLPTLLEGVFSWISLRLGVLIWVGAILISSCAQEIPEPNQPEAISMPPSVQATSDQGRSIVKLNATQAADLDIATYPVSASRVRFTIEMPGSVLPAPEHFAILSAPINGRVDQIFAHEGERVRKGQVLATLESLEFATLAASYLQAKADETYFTQQVQRLEMLVEKKISPQSTLDKAKADLQRADASVRAVYAQLRTLGVSDQQLESWQQGEDGRPLLALRAPISGVLDDHLIDLGQAVTAYQKVSTIINLERVMVRGFMAPEEASLVKLGDSVTVSMGNLSGQKILGRVATINPSLDEASKSVVINALVETQNGWPVPGQRIEMSVMVSPAQDVLTVPLEALQYEGGDAIVYVSEDSQTFEKRVVTVDRVTADQAIISSGLEEGEQVVVSQVFSLKALDRYDQYSE